ncbi:MAG: hypothetical protein GW941_02740 [Candidatus Pacebacteria bacterium]|nr:hypothetical protein [Candidatus Paceibacterota bacterium]
MVKIINFIKLVKNYFALSFLLIIFLGSSWSLLRPGFFRAHDYVHGARIAEMTRALEDGHFPVRWSENFGYGFGMPLYEFYAPLPYYVGSLFYWLGVDLIVSVKIIFLIANIGSLIGAYKLGKMLFGVRGGILLSAAFTLAPYRAVNLFVRGALSEAWGMMALPWILLGIIQIVKDKNNKGIITLIFGLVILMLSHNLTTLMFVPFSFIFAIGYAFISTKKFRSFLPLISKITGGYLLGGGLSAFYMLPAFTEKQFTQISTILGGYFHYSNHFLYIRQFFYPNWGFNGSGWGPNDDISFFLGYGQIIALVISLFAFVYIIKEKKLFKNWKNANEKYYLYPLVGILTAISLFMTILKSKFLWDTLPLLNFIQFPWRFLSVSIIFIAIITALSMKLINHMVMRFFYFLAIFWVLILGNFYYFRPEKMMDDSTALYYADENRIRIGMSDVLKDYVPIQMSLDGNVLKTLYQEFSLPEKTVVQIDKTHQKLYSVELDSPSLVAFPIANFPGWEVEVDGKLVESQTTEDGLLAVQLDSGKYQVGINLEGTNIRNIADVISFLSLLILLALLVSLKEEKEKPFFKRIS